MAYINTSLFLSDEGPMLETLDHTIRIGSTPTFLYFDLYLHSAYVAHYVILILTYSSGVSTVRHILCITFCASHGIFNEAASLWSLDGGGVTYFCATKVCIPVVNAH